MERIFITGIGTGVGKTIASAVITEALKADYWKPVQTGSNEDTDSETVRRLISNPASKIHPESFCLHLPASPHAAAEAENIAIKITDITVPQANNKLVIEGAGGLMVPLNYKELMIDLVKKLDATVILVVRDYLGNINHTLLSVEALQRRNIPVAGVIYSGGPNPLSEKAMESFCNYKVLGRIGEEPFFNSHVVARYAEKLKPALQGLF